MKPLFFLLLALATSLLKAGEGYNSYATTNHPKAQGVSVSLDYPLGWTPNENPSPGIVHEFRDPKTGGKTALLLVVPTKQPKSRTSLDDLKKAFASENFQKQIVPGATHKKKELIEAPFPCVALDYDLNSPQFSPEIIQVRNYIFWIEDRMLQVQFYYVGPPSTDLRAPSNEMMSHIVRSVKKLD